MTTIPRALFVAAVLIAALPSARAQSWRAPDARAVLAPEDTVTATRYAPLEVGLIRGYIVESSAPTFYVRETITDYGTVVNGRTYFTLVRARVEPDGTVLAENPFLVRYDTLRAQVVRPNADGESAFRNSCPLDAPLDEISDTDNGACFVTGNYAFEYVFPDPVSGEPADTLQSQAKSFQYPSFTLTYVADLGYVVRDGEFFNERLVYFKGSGGEYGSEPVVTSSEDRPDQPAPVFVEAFPNPFTDRVRLMVRGGVVCDSVRVVDLLGRTVAEGEGCSRSLNLGDGMAPGSYVVQVTLRDPQEGGRTASVVVTKR